MKNVKKTQDNINKPAPLNQFMLTLLLYVGLKLKR